MTLFEYFIFLKSIWRSLLKISIFDIIWTILNCCHNFKAKSESVFVYAFVVKQKTNLTWEFQYLSWIMYSHCKSEHQYLVAFLYEVVLSLKHISPHNSEIGMKENNASLKLQSLSSFRRYNAEKSSLLLLINLARSLKKYFSILLYIRLNIGIYPVLFHSHKSLL